MPEKQLDQPKTPSKPRVQSQPGDKPVVDEIVDKPAVDKPVAQPREIGGPKGPEPTRYGDWEVNGRCTDF